MKNLIVLFLFSIILNSCSSYHQTHKPKKLILLIGDGMGPQQISLLYYFIKYGKKANGQEFGFEKFAENGSLAISATEPHDKIVVDSACSATQLATGERSRSEMIGLDKDGNSILTILEKAQAKGLKTGLVSDTRITHATPASFASHVANRWSEDEIAEQLIKTAPDILYSGGLRQFVPKGYKGKIGGLRVKSKRKDSKNLLEEARSKYSLITKKSELNNHDNKKVLGLFANSNMPDGIWFTQNEKDSKREIPNLLEMTKSAVHKLDSSESGYFLMVEGGQIDWAAHGNDVGTLLHEMVNFNKTLLWLIDWIEKNPDTLLVVTADHETGGFGFSYHAADLPKPKKLSGEKFKTEDFRPKYNYGDLSVLDKIYGQKKSYRRILEGFASLPKKKQTSEELRQIVSANTEFKIQRSDMARVIKKVKNPFYAAWNDSFNRKTIPKINEFEEFFATRYDVESTLIARSMSAEQSVIWGSSGHTATPVFVFSKGGGDFYKNFKGYINHKKVGRMMQEYLDL